MANVNLSHPTLGVEVRSRLVKILRLLGSDQVGERASAAARAHAIVSSAGLDWADILIDAVDPEDDSDRTLYSVAVAGREALNAWDKNFLVGVAPRIIANTPLSFKQRRILEQLAAKARAAQAVAA